LDTLEHIDAYPAAIRELFRVLAPHGLALVHVPVYYFDKPEGEPIRPGVDPWEHVRYFSAREFLRLFDEAGFVILRASFNFDYGALIAVLGKEA
jgi:ubiquinone/menaquinone biosynthesis C-methylase UbiE